MIINQIPTVWWKKCRRYPRSKICVLQKGGPKFTKIFQGMLPPKTSHRANFIEIGQTSLEKSVKKRYLFGPSRHFFCHGQKRDYLSRVSQRARGATKNRENPSSAEIIGLQFKKKKFPQAKHIPGGLNEARWDEISDMNERSRYDRDVQKPLRGPIDLPDYGRCWTIHGKHSSSRRPRSTISQSAKPHQCNVT